MYDDGKHASVCVCVLHVPYTQVCVNKARKIEFVKDWKKQKNRTKTQLFR